MFEKKQRYSGTSILAVLLVTIGFTQTADSHSRNRYISNQLFGFERIASFPVFLNTDVDKETVAEIVAASQNGKTLIYTDSETENIGFIDISDPSNPQAESVVAVGGEPTSVAVRGGYALVGVNTSESYANPSGLLRVVDIKEKTVVRSMELGGQPDCVAVSPDHRYAAIAIENERDEDLGDGAPPQMPAGFVVIVDTRGPVQSWGIRQVDLRGIPALFPEDPEPEYVAINRRNIAAVTLQENNHMVLIDLRSGRVIDDWSLGAVDLFDIDTNENDLIELSSDLAAVPREADAVTWTDNGELVTADEGDLFGGSRSFTIFSPWGDVLYNSGNTMDHLAVRVGHYPEDRSENKGTEPEGVAFGRYGFRDLLFVGSERANMVAVYELPPHRATPRLVQVLPTGVGPEGLLAIPKRGLFVTASENDSRDDKYRSVVTIYRLAAGEPSYPTIVSTDREDGLPIPWGALSGLAADPVDPNYAYAVHDSFYQMSRIYELDVSQTPARIVGEIVLTRQGETVDLDLEGLAVRQDGGFWAVSEGAGSVDDPDKPVTSSNLLHRVTEDGVIDLDIELPPEVNDLQRRFGLEGVASVGRGDDELVYVAFQREWLSDSEGLVRIGRYHPASEEWRFFYYPLDTPTSPNGGWVGLSEIVALNKTSFAVVERDNQGGTDATIKKIYAFSVDGLEPAVQGTTFPILDKTEVYDLIPTLRSTGGPVLEKVEGLAILANGDTLIVTDNDGVDDATGETQLIHLGEIF